MATSPKPDFKRARSEDQKAERAVAILDAAREALAENPDPWSLSLSDLARRVGMSKSSIYRYFESLETVLLALLGQEWEGWGDDVRALLEEPITRVAGGGTHRAADPLAAALAQALARRPLLCHLQAALPVLMERNTPPEHIHAFKRRGVELMGELAHGMHRVEPELSIEQHAEAIRHLLVLMIGLWPLANPTPAAKEAVDGLDLEELHFEFERDLTRALTLAMAGLRAERPT